MIDSHCHLYFSSLREKFDDIILNIKKANITSLLSINTHPKDFSNHLKLINKYDCINISYGLHPQEIDNNIKIESNEIINFSNHSKVIGIGETGLDFFHSTEFKKKQYNIFEKHIEASIITNLPLIIHQRNSEKEIIDVLKYYEKSNKLSVVFHCFTGSTELLKFCNENNYFISISGIITFKNANKLRQILKNSNINNLLIETDSPFLAPEPMRGKQNEPSYIRFIAEYLSNFFNIPLNEFVNITDTNFYKLFSKAKRYNNFQ